jgi:UDP-2,3-diacylglucosamine pyrophosphatase LpxH
MINRLAVFSDLHLAPPGPLNNCRSAAELAACLRATSTPETLLVLAGDVFDFLQLDGRPAVLDLAGAPALVARVLAGLDTDGQAVLAAVGDHVHTGGRVWVMPGNHDPELAHPAAEAILRQATGLDPTDPGLEVKVGSPLDFDAAGWQVRLGHGHAGDGWNEIAAADVRKAVQRGDASLPLPPGSHFVLGPINAQKNRPGWQFVDRLKPEGKGIFLLLLFLDPVATLKGVPPFLDFRTEAAVRALKRRLRSGPVLGEASTELLDLNSTLAELLATEAEGIQVELAARELEDWLEGRLGAEGDVLAGGVSNRLVRWAFRRATAGFFSLDRPSSDDQRVIDEHLPTDVRRRVVIAGHTHAARSSTLPGERIYLNTGTWTDLLRFPGDVSDPELEAWKAALLRNEVPPLQRLTYAVVDEDGPRLAWWKPDPLAASNEEG